MVLGFFRGWYLRWAPLNESCPSKWKNGKRLCTWRTAITQNKTIEWKRVDPGDRQRWAVIRSPMCMLLIAGCLDIFPTVGKEPSKYCGKEESCTQVTRTGVRRNCRRTSLAGGIPGSSDGKESACNAEDPGSVPNPGRSSGEGNGYSLQYSCLDNSMDRGVWRATVSWGHKESDATEQSDLPWWPGS